MHNSAQSANQTLFSIFSLAKLSPFLERFKRTMSRKALFILFVALAVALVPALSTAQAQSRTVVTWFVGLGTGTNPDQI